MSKPPTCETCGKPMVRLILGMPVLEDWKRAERGEIVLGGCVVAGDEPDWVCATCKD